MAAELAGAPATSWLGVVLAAVVVAVIGWHFAYSAWRDFRDRR